MSRVWSLFDTTINLPSPVGQVKLITIYVFLGGLGLVSMFINRMFGGNGE